jgi:hypothetical protein
MEIIDLKFSQKIIWYWYGNPETKIQDEVGGFLTNYDIYASLTPATFSTITNSIPADSRQIKSCCFIEDNLPYQLALDIIDSHNISVDQLNA